MTNKPPPGIREYANAYQCADCPADIDPPYQDAHGIWHIEIHHEPDCPVLNGTTPVHTAGTKAAKHAAEASGEAVLYVAEENSSD